LDRSRAKQLNDGIDSYVTDTGKKLTTFKFDQIWQQCARQLSRGGAAVVASHACNESEWKCHSHCLDLALEKKRRKKTVYIIPVIVLY